MAGTSVMISSSTERTGTRPLGLILKSSGGAPCRTARGCGW